MIRWNARIEDICSAAYDQFLATDSPVLAAIMAEHARAATPRGITVLSRHTLDGEPIPD